MAPETPDKKSTKKARSLTSGELRGITDARAKKATRKVAVAKKPDSGRLITVTVWSRGNTNPLVGAFLSEHRSQRTVKRTPTEWIELFRKWKERPRG